MEMEDCLTLQELYILVGKARENRYEDQKFLAALKGIDLDENKGTESNSFEDAKFRAEAKLAGMSEQEHFFNTVGIEVEYD